MGNGKFLGNPDEMLGGNLATDQCPIHGGSVVFTPSHLMLLGNCDKLHLGGLISSCTDFSHLHTHIEIDTRSGNAGICAQT